MITINLEKARAIGHDIRRSMRDEEFKPLDEIIAKQIPGKASTVAEASRAAIRRKYDVMQAAIDAATVVDQIKAALKS